MRWWAAGEGVSLTDFVQAKEFPNTASQCKCYVSPTWIVLERGSRAFAPSTNEIAHMKMSYARTYPIVTHFAVPAEEGPSLSSLLSVRSDSLRHTIFVDKL